MRARGGSIGTFIEGTRGRFSCSKLCDDKCRREQLTRSLSRWARTNARFRCQVMCIVIYESVKYTDRAFEKTVIHKRQSRNHLLDQVESFRFGDRGSDREDDLLDTFCYGIVPALGNSEGF
jgi:hypothetical protein